MAEPTLLAIEPGGMPGPWSIEAVHGRGEQIEIRRVDDEDRTSIVVSVTADADVAAGAVLFGGGIVADHPNDLFADHFPDREYRGESHGLLFSPQETRL